MRTRLHCIIVVYVLSATNCFAQTQEQIDEFFPATMWSADDVSMTLGSLSSLEAASQNALKDLQRAISQMEKADSPTEIEDFPLRLVWASGLIDTSEEILNEKILLLKRMAKIEYKERFISSSLLYSLSLVPCRRAATASGIQRINDFFSGSHDLPYYSDARRVFLQCSTKGVYQNEWRNDNYLELVVWAGVPGAGDKSYIRLAYNPTGGAGKEFWRYDPSLISIADFQSRETPGKKEYTLLTDIKTLSKKDFFFVSYDVIPEDSDLLHVMTRWDRVEDRVEPTMLYFDHIGNVIIDLYSDGFARW